ncbi:MAG: hypothetical protein H7Y43_10105 [Akkermansiaceae bacterium]|nr:hypothetical protein [Verrucomicrobiales bacterium]
MNKARILLSGVIAGGLAILSALPTNAQTVIYTDNFNIPDTASLDGSDQTGRHTGVLATNIVGRSGGIQNAITNGTLVLLRTGGGSDGRMRFTAATNTAGRWDWASGTAGAAITAAGGMRVEFDWTAIDNTSANWISFTAGITPNTDVATRVANSGTDSGILLRNNGGAQVFKNGVGGATSSFDTTSLTHHVKLDYAFTSWADTSPVTLNAYVDDVLVLSQSFTWNGNSGIQNLEISGLVTYNYIDNFTVQTFAPPPFINVSAVSDSPATVYAGRTVNLIGTVGGTQPITNQWKVDKGSGYVDVSPTATNTTLTLSNIQVTDTGTYQLFSANVAGSATSDPISVQVLPATTTDFINVQFVGSAFGGGNAPAQTGPGLIGNDGDVWNQISNPIGGTSPAGLAVGTNLSLVDATAVGTTITMDYVADYLFSGAFGPTPNPFLLAGSPYANLMTGYMGSVSNGGRPDTNTMTIRNLKPGSYDLYLYASGRSDGQTRINVFTANGLTAVCGPNSGNNVLIAGTNYVHLTPTVTTNGVLNISMYGTVDAGQGLLNGFQLNGPVTLPSLFLSSDTTSDSPQTNYVGRSVTLQAGFSGNPPPSLQWKVDKGLGFVNVPGATNASITILNAQTTNTGSYSLFASNVVGTLNSTASSLTIVPVPSTNFGVNVNVQFVGTSRGTGFAATQTGPAVIGNAGDIWNLVSNPNPVLPDTSPIFGAGEILSDAMGIGTTYTLDYTGSADLNTGVNNPFVGSGSPAENLMQAFLAAENTNTATVTLHGLAPGAYNLYLYSSSANGAGQSNITQFTANGAMASVGPNDALNVLTEGTNYVRIAPTVAANGILTISFISTSETGGAQLNGFQLSGPGATPSIVVLTIERIASDLRLTWPIGTLLESTNVLGPWTTNANTSPYTFTPLLSTPQKFYRVQVQ